MNNINNNNHDNKDQNTTSSHIPKDSLLTNSNLANEVSNMFLNGPGIAPAHLSLTLEANSGPGTSRADAIRKKINDTLNTVLQNKNSNYSSPVAQSRSTTNYSSSTLTNGGYNPTANNNRISNTYNLYHRPIASKPLQPQASASIQKNPVVRISRIENPFFSNAKFYNQFSNTDLNQSNTPSSSSRRYKNKSTRKYVKSGNFSRQKLLERKLLNQGHPIRAQQPILPHPNSETSTTSYSKEPNASPHIQVQNIRTNVNMIKVPHLIPTMSKILFPPESMPTHSQPTSYLKDSQEIERNRELKVRLQKTLEIEQQTISHPTYLVPFSSKRDAIERLLPYHVYQYPNLPNPHQTNLEVVSSMNSIEEMLPRIGQKLEKFIEEKSYESSLEPHSNDTQLNRLLNSLTD